jgi:hypothetical protein
LAARAQREPRRHPRPHARGVRPQRLHRDRRGPRDRPDRAAGHLRRADPVFGLHVDGFGPDTDTKVATTRLAAGILVDATVIRALIVPAVVLLMGRWNWWLLRWPARLLRVEPSEVRAPAG